MKSASESSNADLFASVDLHDNVEEKKKRTKGQTDSFVYWSRKTVTTGYWQPIGKHLNIRFTFTEDALDGFYKDLTRKAH